jgi:hypothetical protein
MAAAVAAMAAVAAVAAHLAQDHLDTSLDEKEATAQPVDQDDGNDSRANIHSLRQGTKMHTAEHSTARGDVRQGLVCSRGASMLHVRYCGCTAKAVRQRSRERAAEPTRLRLSLLSHSVC